MGPELCHRAAPGGQDGNSQQPQAQEGWPGMHQDGLCPQQYSPSLAECRGAANGALSWSLVGDTGGCPVPRGQRQQGQARDCRLARGGSLECLQWLEVS